MPNPNYRRLLIDSAVLGELRQLSTPTDPNTDIELIELYLSTTHEQLEKLEKSVTEGNLTATSRTSHSLKSSSASVGALVLSALCEQLEKATLGTPPTPAEVRRMFDQIRETFADTEAALRSYLVDRSKSQSA